MFNKFIMKVQQNINLTTEEMMTASHLIFDEATPANEIQTFLIALAAKGETAQELAALAIVMKEHALALPVPTAQYIDNCGTGGDGCNSFNISTASAFVLAAANVKVAKHGNRKISSASGSSDILEELGIHTQFTPEQLADLLAKENIAFIFAPLVHPKLKRIGEIRRAIGKPTIFNLVGPLANPVNLPTQFTGINRKDFIIDYAQVMNMIGRERAVIVCGAGNMDEASLAGENHLVLLDNQEIVPFTLTPEEVGLTRAPIEAIAGGDAQQNARILRQIFDGQRDAYFDAVAFNSGIAFYANGKVKTIKEGVELAIETIENGKAKQKLEAIVTYAQQLTKEAV